MGEVKGGIMINQMKAYAKRLSDHTGCTSNVRVQVWYHPRLEGSQFNTFNVEFSIWDSGKSTHYKPIGKHNDFRKLGKLIDQIILDEKEG